MLICTILRCAKVVVVQFEEVLFPMAIFLWVEIQKRGTTPKTDGLFHGKAYFSMDDLGGKNFKTHHFFRKHPYKNSKKHDNKIPQQTKRGTHPVKTPGISTIN